jgi:hypothetical protein
MFLVQKKKNTRQALVTMREEAQLSDFLGTGGTPQCHLIALTEHRKHFLLPGQWWRVWGDRNIKEISSKTLKN